MKIRLTPRALWETERKQTWWRANRPAARDLFDDEIDAALRQIRAMPSVGALYPSSFGTVVRRLLLPRTRNHVYYAAYEGEIVVLSVWGAPRGSGPKV